MLFTRRAIGLPRCGAGCADRKVSQARNPLPLRMDWSQSLRLDTALLRLGGAFLAFFVHLCFSRFFNAFTSQLFSSAVSFVPSASITTTSARKPNGLIVPCLRTNVPVSDRRLSGTMLTAGHNVRDKARLCRQLPLSGVDDGRP